ncbi:hypothetical protein Ato02nite_072680 [Paractinoplanes toevensis]|uniref:Uncharacterized protein n=1 Tax=Paractinoplanes toevensis TaxID=571911 RepID=A0A919TH65_9ACTN|nr:hypothetical protein Ato02nite_072680 [Actinoplanes toevensis]
MRYQQLQLFTRPVTAAMRDRTRARNYSPSNAEFWREHARRRRWALARRHALKQCRLHGCSRECGELGLHDEAEPVPPLLWLDEATLTQRPSPERDVPVQAGLASPGAQPPSLADQAALGHRPQAPACAEPARRADITARTVPTGPTVAVTSAASARRAHTIGRGQSRPRGRRGPRRADAVDRGPPTVADRRSPANDIDRPLPAHH